MRKFLEYASSAYYEGNPIMPDEQFDALAEQYNFYSVGYSVTDGIPQLYRMYSLQKVFDISEIPDLSPYVKTPKLDGAAISLTYINGDLAVALTRGDGNVGRDITDKAMYLVPSRIDTPSSSLFITGEVVAPSSIPNSRNFAAGSLNLKDAGAEFASRPLTFVAYGVQGELENPTWEECMQQLHNLGFTVITKFDHTEYPTDGWVYRVNNNTKYENIL